MLTLHAFIYLITLCAERVMVRGEPAEDRITGHRYLGEMAVKTDKTNR